MSPADRPPLCTGRCCWPSADGRRDGLLWRLAVLVLTSDLAVVVALLVLLAVVAWMRGGAR